MACEPASLLPVPAVVELPPVGLGLPLPPLLDPPVVDVFPAMGTMTVGPAPSPPELHAQLAEAIPERRRTEASGRDLSMAEPLERN